jgi:hypothetical protein
MVWLKDWLGSRRELGPPMLLAIEVGVVIVDFSDLACKRILYILYFYSKTPTTTPTAVLMAEALLQCALPYRDHQCLPQNAQSGLDCIQTENCEDPAHFCMI